MLRRTIWLAGLAVCLASTLAVAQVRITGAISGIVTDSSGLVVPGAAVQLKDEGTGISQESATNSSGAFQFPNLNSGSYTVTITLAGFQKAVYDKVIVESSHTTDLRVTLSVGNVGETVTVSGASPILEATQNTISTTIPRKQVVELPLTSRDAFGLARLVPGAVAPSGVGNSGSTHYNGMPGGVINPTIDGINNSSNGFKSGGTSFFDTVPSRLGAVEEVTVETAGLGGDAGVEGGVNLKFVTRRGTSTYHGGAFDEAQNDTLNANSYFNTSRGIAKPKLRRHDFGFNFGGPMVPKDKWRDKLFLFVNYEEQWAPLTQSRSNTILTEEARSGVFRYQTSTGEQRTVNLYNIAAANGFQSTPDPLMGALLAQQATSRGLGTVSSNNNLRTDLVSWVQPQTNVFYYPTARADYQITPKLSWMGSWNLYRQDQRGRPNWMFSGYPIQLDTFHSSWWITSTGLNWQATSNLFNEFRYGVQHSGDDTPGREFEDYKLNGIANTGLPLRLSMPLGLNTLSADNAPITGRHYITTLYDTTTWLKGKHTIKFGGNYRDTQWHDTSLDGTGSGGYLGLPRYTIASPAGDPAAAIFNSTTIPGLQSADQATALSLWSLLTGRVSQVVTGAVVDPKTLQYSQTVYRENWTSAHFFGVFAQDSWRLKPDFTVNAGMRWEVSWAPYNHLGIAVFPDYANLLGPSTGLFQPGVLNGVANPTMHRGKVAAGTDWVNPAPRIGFAWTPHFSDSSWAGKILGHTNQTVIRGSYDITYYDEGTNMFSSTAGNNPGQSQQWLLSPGIGFTPGSLTLQSPLPPFTKFPLAYQDVWPQSDFTFGTTGFSTMKDTLKMPSVQSWNIGVQREITKTMVVEARYLGNNSSNVWRTYNVNEVNTIENGFTNEFKNAQKNLAINQANGVTSFANTGLPGQVALPIFDSMFGARGSQPALPVSQGYTNGTFINNLQLGEAGRMAQTLASNVNYACRLYGSSFGPCATRGYDAPGTQPINFFYPNPFATGGSLFLVDDGSYTNYNAMQLQLRRRYSRGVTANVNYTLGYNKGDTWADNATQQANYQTLRNKRLNYGPTPFDVRHVLQAYGTYDLPFGKDRHVDIGNPILNGIVGDWVIGGILTSQSGSPFRLSSGRQTLNQEDAGVILAPGVSVKDLQKLIGNFPGPVNSPNRYFINPSAIGPDGRVSSAYLLPPTTPGELGQIVYLRTPASWNLDASLNKSVPLTGGGTKLLIHLNVLNALNHPVWSTGPIPAAGGPGLNFINDANITSTTFGQVAQPLNSARRVIIRAEVQF
jgi:hypothetical protein